METISNLQNSAFQCGSVRVVRGRKPGYSMLCAENNDGLSDGQRLRIMRLSAGLTIWEAAEMVGISRHTLMNYESGRTSFKRKFSEKFQLLYRTLLSSIK